MPTLRAEIYQLPVDATKDSIVELGDGTRRYRKQLVKFGTWVHPNDPTKKMVLDRPWAEKLVANFANKVRDRIPVVYGHPQTDAELVTQTKGDLGALSVEADGVYGELNIKDGQTAAGIDNDTIFDVSVSFDPEYVDKRNGDNVGPALRHIGIVNNPYLKGMQPFEALSEGANVIMLSESEELAMSVVKNDREFAVTVEYEVDGETKTILVEPGSEIEVPEAVVEAVTKQVADAAAPEASGDDKKDDEGDKSEDKSEDKPEDKPADDKAEDEQKDELSELEKVQRELSEANAKLASQAAERTYETLLSEGKIVPAQKDAFMQLSTAATGEISLSDGSTKSLPEVLADFLKAAPKRINFGEDGSSGDEGEKKPWDQLSEGEKEANAKLGISESEFNKINSPEADDSKAEGAKQE